MHAIMHVCNNAYLLRLSKKELIVKNIIETTIINTLQLNSYKFLI